MKLKINKPTSVVEEEPKPELVLSNYKWSIKVQIWNKLGRRLKGNVYKLIAPTKDEAFKVLQKRLAFSGRFVVTRIRQGKEIN